MKVIKEGDHQVIRCECGEKIFDGHVLKTRVALINNGYICIKCPRCKRMTDSVSIKQVFLEEQDG